MSVDTPPMELHILTPDRAYHLKDICAVTAMTTDGEIGILPRHIPLLTPLTISVVRYKTTQEANNKVAVMGGVLYTDGHNVTLLCAAAELAKDIDAIRAEEARHRAEASLQQRHEEQATQEAELALQRANVRLLAVRKWVADHGPTKTQHS